MDLSEIDRLCDLFEHRLKAGEKLSVEGFVAQENLKMDEELLVELNKLSREYRASPIDDPSVKTILDAVHCSADVMPRVAALNSNTGNYRLLQKLGEGGMGVVYLANQIAPIKRQVALKVIKPGMDSQQVLWRFEAERQALARMDHPNIARVLDAGTTEDGRPYFVMEYVNGVSITRYCDEKGLTPSQRLGLFIPVCQAVQHAHHKGVMHRDLKPTNVLVMEVDGRPVSKVIDFGLAKAVGAGLTEHTVATQFGQIVGTIGYMSPEQASFNPADIDTRTDVYSLGVLLYELLSGDTPFDRQRLHRAALDELLQIIQKEQPPRPSARLSSHSSLQAIAASRRTEPKKLGLLIRGDLDWIVMKAIEKDRTRRYETPNSFSLDVQRYLNQEPVVACPPSATYQLRKFVLRHRGPVLATVLVFLTFIAGIIGTTAGLIRAVRAEKIARRQQVLSAWDYGRQLCESGEIGHGLLVIAQAVESVPVEETDLKAPLQFELASWHQQCHTLLRLFPHPDQVLALAVNPEGTTFVSGCADGIVRRFELDYETQEVLGRYHGEVRAVAFSTDGTMIIAGGTNGQLTVWNSSTGVKLGRLNGHSGDIRAVVVSPDGDLLLTGATDQEARLWDLTARVSIRTIQHDAPVLAAAFSEDGTQFVTGGGDANKEFGEFRIFNTNPKAEGPVFHEVSKHGVLSTAFSPIGGTWLIGNADWEASFRDLTSLKTLATIDYGNGKINSLDISADGKYALMGAYESKLCTLWAVPQLQSHWERQQENGVILTQHGSPTPLMPILPHPEPITDVAFVDSEGRRFLTACEDGFVRLWQRAPGMEKKLIAHGEGPTEANRRLVVKAVAISPDGRLAATADDDGRVRFWNASTGSSAGNVVECHSSVTSLAFTPDGKSALTGSRDKRMRFWDVSTGREVSASTQFSANISGLSICRSSDTILVGGGGRAQRYSLQPFTKLGTPLLHSPDDPEMNLNTAMASDESRFLTCGEDGRAKLWDRRGRLIAELEHQNEVRSGAFSHDSRWVATASDDMSVRIWEASTGKHVATLLHESEVFAVAFADDDRIITGSRAGAQIWDRNLKRRLGPACVTGDAVMCIACSLDGSTAVLGDWDGNVVIWSMPRPIPRTPQRVSEWAQTEVGMELDNTGGRTILTGDGWLKYRQVNSR